MAKVHRLLRERAALWVVVCIVAGLSGCAGAGTPYVVDEFPTDRARLAEIRTAVLADAPDSTEFLRHGGDGQRLIVMVGGARTYGPLVRIFPHKYAQRGRWQTHGKVLARIWSESAYNGARLRVPAGWSYWVIAQLNGSWQSVIVSESESEVYPQPLTFSEHPGEACEGKATFLWREDGEAAWSCCEPNGCCCTGPTCAISGE